jgi:hypothetical protein
VLQELVSRSEATEGPWRQTWALASKGQGEEACGACNKIRSREQGGRDAATLRRRIMSHKREGVVGEPEYAVFEAYFAVTSFKFPVPRRREFHQSSPFSKGLQRASLQLPAMIFAISLYFSLLAGNSRWRLVRHTLGPQPRFRFFGSYLASITFGSVISFRPPIWWSFRTFVVASFARRWAWRLRVAESARSKVSLA